MANGTHVICSQATRVFARFHASHLASAPQHSGSDGGGLLTVGASSAVFDDCTFRDNTVTFNGGGVFNSLGSPTYNNCTFTGNSAANGGGGMATGLGTPELNGCRFWCNDPNAVSGSYDGSDNCINDDCTECDPVDEDCPPDFNIDGIVNGADLTYLLGSWGGGEGDLDDDGTTTGSDLAILLGFWGDCP